MKFDFKNIRIRIWLYFISLTVSVLAMLWLFQVVMLGSSFESMKIEQVEGVAEVIETGLREDGFGYQTQITAVQNSVCGLVYNQKGDLLYQVDALGMACVLNDRTIGLSQKVNEYIKLLDVSETNTFSITIKNTVLQQDMLIYGKKVLASFGNYYILLNSPLLPLDSTTTILQNQFVVVTLIVFVLFTLVSLFISRRIATPIVKMKKSALELADGNYDVRFDAGEFTEITDLANTLNQTTVELKKMDDLRRDLIANVSHDIKTPLTMIKAYAEMIRDLSGNNKEKREEHLNVILTEVDHLDHLASDMTQLSQLRSNVLSINIQPFDITELFKQSIDMVTALLDKKGIMYEFFAPDEVLVLGDALKIKQVLLNFITNAIKFVGQDKLLIFQILTQSDGVRVEVIDHGLGISEEDLPYIWDRYFKIDKHHRRNSEGTGLGLSIASAILKNHHVHFGVISKVNEGSTFWFELSYAIKPESAS